MKSRSEVITGGGKQKMEGVNMPGSFKFAWRWLVGATAATILCVAALPGVGRAENIEICINNNSGKIVGINLGIDGCTGNTTELDWVTTGPSGPTGMQGVMGDPGNRGRKDLRAPLAFRDLRESREMRGRRVLRELSGRRDLPARQELWVRTESAARLG